MSDRDFQPGEVTATKARPPITTMLDRTAIIELRIFRDLRAALLAISSWTLTFILTRTSSLASLISTPLILPLLAWQKPEALLPMSALTALIVWRHRSNLRDLLDGRERHF